jgi:NAD(P)-dependent dehydrogenase (short-subunit alcohol dehydrogenase family)
MAQETTLAGRRALVTGGDSGFGLALLEGLRAAGAKVATLSLPDNTREGIQAACNAAVAELGGLDALVHASSDPDLLTPRPLVETSESEWERSCEGPLQAALFVLQAAYMHLRERGGRIVLITPTISTAGAEGLVALSAGVEAIRILGKSAAKQWGADGITVNSLAPGLDAMSDGREVPRVSLGEAALPQFDPLLDIGPIVSFLASDAAAHLTGATLRVDGGSWTPG